MACGRTGSGHAAGPRPAGDEIADLARCTPVKAYRYPVMRNIPTDTEVVADDLPLADARDNAARHDCEG